MFKGKGSPSVLISKKKGDWARDKTTLAQNLAVISIMPEASMESMVSSFRQVATNSGLAVLAGPHGRGLSPRGRGLSPRGRGLSPRGSSPCKSQQSPRKKKKKRKAGQQPECCGNTACGDDGVHHPLGPKLSWPEGC